MTQAWGALGFNPEGRAEKGLIAKLLRLYPGLIRPERERDLIRLLADPEIEPTYLAAAGWRLVLGGERLRHEAAAAADRLEHDELALRLLEETYVTVLEAERALSAVRRWLLLAREADRYPRLTSALAAQALHNGGAWPFDDDEREALTTQSGQAIVAAYLPPRFSGQPSIAYENPVTEQVAEQYRLWPYPLWGRMTVPLPTSLAATIEQVDPGGGPEPPSAPEILVAGCGTGRQAALLAKRYPESRITAIDISEVSLAYARERCAGLDIEFRLLDLHRVAELGRSFDFISCTGVLHHLPGPEAGWEALTSVLRTGAVMQVMVYSRLARLAVRAAQAQIGDLIGPRIDDDLLRAVRKRLIEKKPELLERWIDFYTLGGVHDLLLHRHEDAFDIPRVKRAIERLGLDLLAFKLPTPAQEAEYRRDWPGDPLLRNLARLAAFEQSRPFTFVGMYDIWCRKPATP